MKFEPIKDELLGAFEKDAERIVSQPDYPADNASVILKYLGQTIARLRCSEKQRDELQVVVEAVAAAFDLEDLSAFTEEQRLAIAKAVGK